MARLNSAHPRGRGRAGGHRSLRGLRYLPAASERTVAAGGADDRCCGDSKLTYDWYENHAARHAPVSTPTADYYHEPNALPHLDVSNGRPSRGYFNPMLRVVAVDGRVEWLDEIDETIRAAAPDFDVRRVQQRPAQSHRMTVKR